MGAGESTVKPKIYLCAAVGSDVEPLADELRLRGFDVFPDFRGPAPGENRKHALRLRQALRQSADVYVVLGQQGPSPSWHEEDLRQVEARLRGTLPILPVVTPYQSLLPPGLDEIVPLEVATFAEPFVGDSIARAVWTMLAKRPARTATTAGSQAYIAAITVRNFLGFRAAQTLDLRTTGGRWTIILGDNGTGKTTLLRAIASCCAHAPDSWREAARGCTLTVSATPDGTGDPILLASEDDDAVRPVCFGYGAGRAAVPARLSAETADPSATLFADNADLPDAEEWFLQVDHALRVKSEPRAKLHYEQVKAVLIDLLPDVDDIQVDSTNQRTHVSVRMHGEWLPMSAMSLGYRTALTWIVDLAQRMFQRHPGSLAPLREPAVVLIDEIDLHLHPRWQRALLDLLTNTFPRTQFVATAHSPLIVQAAPDANLVLLRREDGAIVIDNDKDYVRTWRVDQILASELFGNQPVHSPRVEAMLRERRGILANGGPHENGRLAEIDAELRSMPTAVLPEDQEAMDVVREAAEFIRASKRA